MVKPRCSMLTALPGIPNKGLPWTTTAGSSWAIPIPSAISPVPPMGTTVPGDHGVWGTSSDLHGWAKNSDVAVGPNLDGVVLEWWRRCQPGPKADRLTMIDFPPRLFWSFSLVKQVLAIHSHLCLSPIRCAGFEAAEDHAKTQTPPCEVSNQFSSSTSRYSGQSCIDQGFWSKGVVMWRRNTSGSRPFHIGICNSPSCFRWWLHGQRSGGVRWGKQGFLGWRSFGRLLIW